MQRAGFVFLAYITSRFSGMTMEGTFVSTVLGLVGVGSIAVLFVIGFVLFRVSCRTEHAKQV